LNLLKSIFKFTKIVSITILSTILILSCSESKKGGSEEGIIEFDCKGVDEKHPLYSMAPQSATMKFKHENVIIEMSVMGMFNTSIIINTKNKTLAQTVKFMDLKQACIENEAEILKNNTEYELKIEETDEVKEIIGLKCYKAKVTKLTPPLETFDIWYTKELGMLDCNSLTSYAPIKGVLVDYRIKKMGMELHFKAKSFTSVEIPDKSFEIPASMKIVSVEEMDNYINSLQ
jgi:hypothetical protein